MVVEVIILLLARMGSESACKVDTNFGERCRRLMKNYLHIRMLKCMSLAVGHWLVLSPQTGQKGMIEAPYKACADALSHFPTKLENPAISTDTGGFASSDDQFR